MNYTCVRITIDCCFYDDGPYHYINPCKRNNTDIDNKQIYLDLSSQPSVKLYLISIYYCINFVAITVKGSIATFDVYFV